MGSLGVLSIPDFEGGARFLMTPAHIGLKGNEEADNLAKKDNRTRSG